MQTLTSLLYSKLCFGWWLYNRYLFKYWHPPHIWTWDNIYILNRTTSTSSVVGFFQLSSFPNSYTQKIAPNIFKINVNNFTRSSYIFRNESTRNAIHICKTRIFIYSFQVSAEQSPKAPLAWRSRDLNTKSSVSDLSNPAPSSTIPHRKPVNKLTFPHDVHRYSLGIPMQKPPICHARAWARPWKIWPFHHDSSLDPATSNSSEVNFHFRNKVWRFLGDVFCCWNKRVRMKFQSGRDVLRAEIDRGNKLKCSSIWINAVFDVFFYVRNRCSPVIMQRYTTVRCICRWMTRHYRGSATSLILRKGMFLQNEFHRRR